MREKPDCEQCRWVKERAGKEPPCNICLPTLLESNVEAANIWMIVQDQVITAGIEGAVIALNQLALWKAMDEYRVVRRRDCFEKVRAIFYNFLEIERVRRMNKSGGGK